MKVVDENTIINDHVTQHVDVTSSWYTLLTVYQVFITVSALFGNSVVLFLSHRFGLRACSFCLVRTAFIYPNTTILSYFDLKTELRYLTMVYY